MRQEVMDIAPCPGEKIVDTKDLITALKQPITQMRANESSSTRDQNAPFSQHQQHSNLTLQPTEYVGSCRTVGSCPTSFRTIARTIFGFRLILAGCSAELSGRGYR